MPPKKNQQSDKSKQKDKQKIIEDKTFGLKNKKKSAKVQQQIKQIQSQVMAAGNRKAMVNTSPNFLNLNYTFGLRFDISKKKIERKRNRKTESSK